MFKVGFYNALKYQSIASPTYCYYFEFFTKESKSIINTSERKLGVAHGDDIFLIFNNRNLSDYEKDEIQLGRDFVEMYKDFAQTNEFNNSSMQPISNDNLTCLKIKSPSNFATMHVDGNIFANSDFWKSLGILE